SRALVAAKPSQSLPSAEKNLEMAQAGRGSTSVGKHIGPAATLDQKVIATWARDASRRMERVASETSHKRSKHARLAAHRPGAAGLSDRIALNQPERYYFGVSPPGAAGRYKVTSLAVKPSPAMSLASSGGWQVESIRERLEGNTLRYRNADDRPG